MQSISITSIVNELRLLYNTKITSNKCEKCGEISYLVNKGICIDCNIKSNKKICLECKKLSILFSKELCFFCDIKTKQIVDLSTKERHNSSNEGFVLIEEYALMKKL